MQKAFNCSAMATELYSIFSQVFMQIVEAFCQLWFAQGVQQNQTSLIIILFQPLMS